MFRKTHANFVPSIAAFATMTIALCCGVAQPLAGQSASAQVDVRKPATPAYVSRNLDAECADSNVPASETKSVVDLQPPISCKVDTKGVLTDCRINVGYNLNDVANWFQDDHNRTLHIAFDSVTLAKKFEREFESCMDEKAKK